MKTKEKTAKSNLFDAIIKASVSGNPASKPKKKVIKKKRKETSKTDVFTIE